MHYSHSTPAAMIMHKSCIICGVVASPDLQLQYCAACQSAMYCSRACQRIDWKQRQHKQICKFLNVGHGGRQMRTDTHTNLSNVMQEEIEREVHTLDEGDKRFFRLFEESMFEGSQAAALKMKKYAKRKTKTDQTFLLFHSLHRLLRSSNSEMLSWPNSPLLVLVQLVNPDVLYGPEHNLHTPLHHLATRAAVSDYSTHKNQLILAKQLVEHGANVNAVSIPLGETPLHDACFGGIVTNLDFVEILMEAGANPNAQIEQGLTPLMVTTKYAPGAAKFLLNWPTTDVTITDRSGESFLAKVRKAVEYFSDKAALPDNPEQIQIQHQFMFQQWREIEDMVVESGGH